MTKIFSYLIPQAVRYLTTAGVLSSTAHLVVRLKLRQQWSSGDEVRFSLVVGGTGGIPQELYVPPHNSCVPPIFVDHDKNFFRYFFNLCMTKANLTSITSQRMQTLLSCWNIKATTVEITKVGSIRLHLHDAIHRPDSFVLMLRHCANLKAIRYKSKGFNRIVADKLHYVIAA